MYTSRVQGIWKYLAKGSMLRIGDVSECRMCGGAEGCSVELLQLQLSQALAEIEDIKTVATVSETTKQEAIDQIRQQCQQEVASLQTIMKESLSSYEERLKAAEKERVQWKHYQDSKEREIARLRCQLSGNAAQENLEIDMRKAQEDADRLRSIVMPMEQEIASLKQKLARAEEQLFSDPLGPRWETDNSWKGEAAPPRGRSPREWLLEEKELPSERQAGADTFARNCAAYGVGSGPARCLPPGKEDTASLHSTGTLVPESIYLPPPGHQLLLEAEWNELQQEMKHYQVTSHQTRERLEREMTVRQKLEEALRRSSEDCSQELSILKEKIDVSTLEVERIKEQFAEAQQRTQKQMAELMSSHKELCQKNRLLHKENEALRALHATLQGKAGHSQGHQTWPSQNVDSRQAQADHLPQAGEEQSLDDAYNEVLNRLQEKTAEVETLQRQRQEMQQETGQEAI
ncbi:rab GTPase-binding effector protein 2-like [Stegostoma tigrinum]|uniref:rab GTPase-binding effector protein 2-like n=1 Tax=Stegostoma tigrinum TaxID=3053191 RepID=UPI0028701067|nr:rab GTPase-binding effector protein 2-like [Stegostoma tigrinum]